MIEQPLNNTEKLFEYRSNKKPLKKFKFLNTRSDHVEYATNNDLFKQYEPITISQKEMIETKKQLDKDKIHNTYTKNSYGISTLKTLDNYYVLDNEFYNCVKEFEKDTVLEKCDMTHKSIIVFTLFKTSISFSHINMFYLFRYFFPVSSSVSTKSIVPLK